MNYIDAATTGTLSPYVLPIMDLRKMLVHIEETSSPTLHLPVSSEDTLHFYRYPHTHVLIANKKIFTPIDVPIQDRSQQLSIYKIFTLNTPQETSQHDVTSTLNTLASLRVKQWQWRCHLINSVLVKKPMDKFVMLLPLFNHSKIHHPASQLYTPRTHIAFQQHVHYKLGKLKM